MKVSAGRAAAVLETANAEKVATEMVAARKAENEAADFKRLAEAPWLCVTAALEEAPDKASQKAALEEEAARTAAQKTAAEINDYADFLDTLPPGVYEDLLRSGSVRMMLRMEGLSNEGDLSQQAIRLLKHVRRGVKI